MKHLLTLLCVIVVVSGCTVKKLPESPSTLLPSDPHGSQIELSSGAFKNNGMIPAKYTCDGQNISPVLEISKVPLTAKSLALLVHDPDSPKDFTHWTVWNIPPSTTLITEGGKVQGSVFGMTDAGKNTYSGPCPPSGTHKYLFELYALDAKLNLKDSSVRNEVEDAMKGHVLDQTTLVGLYQRKK